MLGDGTPGEHLTFLLSGGIVFYQEKEKGKNGINENNTNEKNKIISFDLINSNSNMNCSTGYVVQRPTGVKHYRTGTVALTIQHEVGFEKIKKYVTTRYEK